jgi:superfamily II DNA/RNA helicase
VHRLEEYTPSDADPDEARNKLVLEILEQSRGCEGHTLVFANSIESADALHGFLTTSLTKMPADNVLLFHKEVPRDTRHEILRRLQQSDTKLVVVCTDIAARGLDTTRVGHVVQYEFANDVVSYIHRIGRTARAGGSGKGWICLPF